MKPENEPSYGLTPFTVPEGAGLFGDSYLKYNANYPGGSFLKWLGIAPTPQSGGFVLTMTAGGGGASLQQSSSSGGN